MANHRLGLHWLRYHPDDKVDFAHVEKMQYHSVKPFEWMWNSTSFCNNLLATMPQDAYILARDHPKSEQKEAMWSDPIGTGQRHANEWADKVRAAQYRLPIDRSFFLGINEADATTGDRAAIDRYNEAFLMRLQQHGLRGGAFNFSTGHPRTVDGTPHTPPDYSVFEATHAAIVRGHHIAVLHIYGSSKMPLVPGHFDRLRACPWQDVTWVVGECGIDEHVTSGAGHYGYKGLLSGEDYCRWLDTLIMGVNDSRIHSWQVFTYDFSQPWATFDLAPIRNDLERYNWQHARIDAPTVLIPSVELAPTDRPPEIWYVNSPDGLNVRSGPGIGYPRVRGLTHGQAVTVLGVTAESPHWAKLEDGWVAFWLLSDIPPVVVEPGPVEPVPVGNVDQRVLQAILNVESGGNAAGADGRVIIRFENHVFLQRYAAHELFRHGTPSWTNHQWRRNPHEAWRTVHTGAQAAEWEVYEFAASLNREAASESISMGAPQIMGFHYRKFGYASATAMLQAFRNPQTQIVAFFVFLLNTRGLLAAIQQKNWRELARLYNGAANVDSASAKYLAAYRQLGGT